ncbi:hypothetical protein WICPIJ_003748 [Wickerhamomyces pijperi]|uniref:Uncharacterized protein n=1 Tax=Wickerhamomyces pijperi TaxID=599730 RepID=A0A9P8Q9D6_WICPI|nr:hypothetical protein WICPIJ_003748 [Wickerhamomyces pijperi]
MDGTTSRTVAVLDEDLSDFFITGHQDVVNLLQITSQLHRIPRHHVFPFMGQGVINGFEQLNETGLVLQIMDEILVMVSDQYQHSFQDPDLNITDELPVESRVVWIDDSIPLDLVDL